MRKGVVLRLGKKTVLGLLSNHLSKFTALIPLIFFCLRILEVSSHYLKNQLWPTISTFPTRKRNFPFHSPYTESFGKSQAHSEVLDHHQSRSRIAWSGGSPTISIRFALLNWNCYASMRYASDDHSCVKKHVFEQRKLRFIAWVRQRKHPRN